jgi:hypothetical protein
MATRTVANLTAVISANNTNFKKGLKGAQNSMTSFQKSVNTIGKSITPFIGITAGVAVLSRAMKGAFNIIADFDQAMADVKSITGATEDELKRLSDTARALGGITKFTATEVSGLQKEYAKLGFTTEEIVEAQQATLDLAAATNTELVRAAEVAGATIRGFGLAATETLRVTDLMAKSFTTSALDMEKFAESMKLVAPIAKAAGVSIEETTAMLAVLADAGINGSIAGTSLRKIFSELTDEGGTLQDRLQQLSQEGITLASAQDEVGARAKTALLVLNDQIDRLPELEQAYIDAGGAAKEMADVQLDTLRGKLKELESAYQELILEMGDSEEGMSNWKRRVDTAKSALVVMADEVDETEKGLKRFGERVGNVGKALVSWRWWGKSMREAAGEIEEAKRQMMSLTGEMEERLSMVAAETAAEEAAAKAREEEAAGLNKAYEAWKILNDELKEGIKNKESLLEIDRQLAASSREWVNTLQAEKITLDEVAISLADIGDEAQVAEPKLDALLEQFKEGQIQADMIAESLKRAFLAISNEFAQGVADAVTGVKSFGQSLKELAVMILNALGDILIMVGLETFPAGIPLILAGLGTKVIGGIINNRNQGVSGSSINTGPSSNIGTMLYGNDIRNSNNYYTDLYNQVG